MKSDVIDLDNSRLLRKDRRGKRRVNQWNDGTDQIYVGSISYVLKLSMYVSKQARRRSSYIKILRIVLLKKKRNL